MMMAEGRLQGCPEWIDDLLLDLVEVRQLVRGERNA